MTTPQRILVATDFSECSRHAVDVAADLAQTLRAELKIVHVWQITPAVTLGLEVAPDLLATTENAARAELAAEAARVKARLPSVGAVLRNGSPWGEILHVADEERCDLIVMGTHGRSGLSRALVGSVAGHVVRASAVPVMTVRLPPTLGAKRALACGVIVPAP